MPYTGDMTTTLPTLDDLSAAATAVDAAETTREMCAALKVHEAIANALHVCSEVGCGGELAGPYAASGFGYCWDHKVI